MGSALGLTPVVAGRLGIWGHLGGRAGKPSTGLLGDLQPPPQARAGFAQLRSELRVASSLEEGAEGVLDDCALADALAKGKFSQPLGQTEVKGV